MSLRRRGQRNWQRRRFELVSRHFQYFRQRDDAHIGVIPADLIVEDDSFIVSQTGHAKTALYRIVGESIFEEVHIGGEATCG